MSSQSAAARKTLECMTYTKGSLRLLDQRRLPLETVYDEIHTVQNIWDAIQEMRVRGAPAIAVSAALGIAVAASRELEGKSVDEAVNFFTTNCDYVITSRPTAVNLFNTLSAMKKELLEARSPAWKSAADVVACFTAMAERVFEEDVAFNEGIMKCGAKFILSTLPANRTKARVLTICNTGALATSRYGTALGVVRQLFYDGNLEQVYACETRPWNQGARLTVYECVQESIPCTLICDSAVSALLRSTPIDAIVVGADRVCQNGDTANKIGTYQLAVAAKHHGVKFYVAAPSTTLDPSTASGADVVIEERETKEITSVAGKRVIADGPHLSVWNPVFDVTPSELITGGIITESGVVEPAASAPYYDIRKVLQK